jgi:hypothetical protein
MSDFKIPQKALDRGAGQLKLVVGTPSNPTPAICNWEGHRSSDWLSDDGCRLICGVCHPKPTKGRHEARTQE